MSMKTHSPSHPFTDTPKKLLSKAAKGGKAKDYIQTVRDFRQRQQHQLEVCFVSV